MILVDSRIGSRELLNDIRHLGCDAELVEGLTTDFQFYGEGPTGAVLVGVERKSMASTDFIDSMRSNRLAGGQIGRAVDTYDYYYLIVEGIWRRGAEGMLEVGLPWYIPRGNVRYSEVIKFLNGIAMQSNIKLWRTFNESETAATLVDWHDQWQKPWDEHKTGRVVYAPAPNIIQPGKRSFFQREATPVQKWLYQLPGMGDKKTLELSEKFTCPGHIAELTESGWADLEGIAKTGAKKIWSWIHDSKYTG